MNRFLLHSATDSDVDMHSGDSASLTCSISEDSLAASITPKHQGIPRRINGHGLLSNVNMEEEDDVQHLTVVTSDSTVLANAEAERQGGGTPGVRTNSWLRPDDKASDGGFYLEPLMPAALKPAKEKSIHLNKEEESGEARKSSTARRVVGGGNGGGGGEQSASFPRRRANHSLNRTFTPNSSAEFIAQAAEANAASQSETPPVAPSQAFKPLAASSAEISPTDCSPGFFLHSSAADDDDDKQPEQAWEMQSDSDTLDLADEHELELNKDELYSDKQQRLDEEDQESAKLREDMSVKEHDDKDKDGGGGGGGPSSRCSSPGLSSVHSAASSVASGSVRMTSFAERKLHHSRFGSNQDLRSASSSQRTTPDGSENSYSMPLVTSWRSKRDQSPTMGQLPGGKDSANVLASELVQLRMQLEEKRRAIETQKRKMEVLSARQRLKLGKVAFLHLVKKGKSDTLPQPVKSDYCLKDGQKLNGEKEKEAKSKDDACVDALRRGVKEAAKVPEEKGTLEWASSCSTPVSPIIESKGLPLEEELDLNECNRSIELLNEAIGSIQQQMMQLSLQQEVLMKQSTMSPPPMSPLGEQVDAPEGKFPQAMHFEMAPATSGTVRKPPKLSSSSRSGRSKPSELKLAKEHQAKHMGKVSTPTQRSASPGGRTPRGVPEEGVLTLDAGNLRSSTPFQFQEEANLRKAASKVPLGMSFDKGFPGTLSESEHDTDRMEDVMSDEDSRSRANLIEVDMSDLAVEPGDEGSSGVLDLTAEGGDGEKKSGMGFFFKVGLPTAECNLFWCNGLLLFTLMPSPMHF